VVYIGDEEGHLRAFRAADGAAVFDVPVGGRISSCPAVGPAGVFVVSEQGQAALVAPDGAVRWKRELGVEVPGQPIATQTQVLVPTSAGLLALRQADGQADDRARFPASPGRLLAAVPYGPRVCLLTGDAWTHYGGGPVTYAGYNSDAIIWAPEGGEEKK
jgi:outer membrane protein assembly factor BamB